MTRRRAAARCELTELVHAGRTTLSACPAVRHVSHCGAGAAGRARRPEARAPAHPLRHARAGHDVWEAASQVRPHSWAAAMHYRAGSMQACQLAYTSCGTLSTVLGRSQVCQGGGGGAGQVPPARRHSCVQRTRAPGTGLFHAGAPGKPVAGSFSCCHLCCEGCAIATASDALVHLAV